jgi:hypothetical protein
MRHFIIVSHPLPGKADEFIGPFTSKDERDAECARLTLEEKKKTCALVGRMTRRATSYYRTEVKGLVPGERAEKIAA